MLSIKERHSRAKQLVDEIHQLESARDEILWHVAKRYCELKDGSLYKYYWGIEDRAPVRESWRAFVSELGYLARAVEYKVALYKKWIQELRYEVKDVAGIHVRKLEAAIPYATSREKADELLQSMKILSTEEFRGSLKGNKEPCWHMQKETKVKEVKVCKDCGKEINEHHGHGTTTE